MDIKPFRQEHIKEAGELFAKKYTDLRSELPYLPKEASNAHWMADYLLEMIDIHPGVVAIQSGKLVGYMIGYANIKNLKGSQCGAYVPEWGNATIADNHEKIFTELYKEISRSWVDAGSYTHIVSYLANVPIGKVLSLLGFGLQVIDATKDLSLPKVELRTDLTIEKASEKHIPQLQELDHLINEHLESAPIFLKRFSKVQNNGQFENAFLSKDTITCVATKNERVISCIRGTLNHGNIPLLCQDGAFGINFGYTREEYRNGNIATMVLRKAIEVAKQNSATMCGVDFETQNIEGRSFWLSHFSPVVYSMMRKVDDRFEGFTDN